MIAVVQLTAMTAKAFLMLIFRYSDRTLRRRMEDGLIPGAYRTKGKQWRIKKPAGVTGENLRQFFDAGCWKSPDTKKVFPPALIRWCDRVQANEEAFRHNHPFRRIYRRRLAAEAAQRQADEAGFYSLDDLENLGAI
jgi:hypothetical protein